MTQYIKIKTPDGFMLDAVYNHVKGSSKGLIFAHGMTVNKDDEGIFVRAEPLLNKLGYSTMRFDFRAHGKSTGNSITDFTISGELIDLETIVKFMNSQGITWLGLLGASFGGGVAALYAGNHPRKIKKMFLANPALDPNTAFIHPTTVWAVKAFSHVYERFKRFGFIEVASSRFKMGKKVFDEMKIYKPYQNLRKYKNPLLVVHGDRDDKVPFNDTLKCFNLLPNKQKEFKIIKGSEHGFHKEPYETQVVNMIVEFFR